MTTDPAAVDGLPFVKGHGTENDFVLIPDQGNQVELTAGLAAVLCDRRRGPGADGAIRVGRGQDGLFVMDYRNADGSPAQMCGNGARVFARFLVDSGWAAPGRIDFTTRAGLRSAELGPDGDVRIGMGPVQLGGAATATVSGREFPGVTADVGNPHLVCWVDGPDALDALDLGVPPGVDPDRFPEGVNVEFAVRIADEHARMRVHERGSGETRSCGTGTVAVAAVLLAQQHRSTGTVRIDVPGGSVEVEIADGLATLAGPAVLSYSGTVNPRILAG